MENLLFSYVGVCNGGLERGSDCELQKEKKVSGFVTINPLNTELNPICQ